MWKYVGINIPNVDDVVMHVLSEFVADMQVVTFQDEPTELSQVLRGVPDGVLLVEKLCVGGNYECLFRDEQGKMLELGCEPEEAPDVPWCRSNRTAYFLEIAQRMRKVTLSGLFEVHVTVDGVGVDVTRFREFCAQHKLKPVLIELPKGAARTQLMTASYHSAKSCAQVQRKSLELAKLMASEYKVVRVKIEATMSAKGVPETDEDALSKFPLSNYFEFHVKLKLPLNTDYSQLKLLTRKHDAHLSRNALKVVGNVEERFLTLRIYRCGSRNALGRFEALVQELTESRYEIVSKMREYSFYDSNVTLDRGWLVVSH